MGGFKTEWRVEILPLYPEAKGKIAYYQEIITKLDSLHTIGYENLLYDKKSDNAKDVFLDKNDYKYLVTNPKTAGAYYNEYKDLIK